MLLSEIAAKLGTQLYGDSDVDITGVNTIQDAGETELCFLTSSKHAKKLDQSRAAGVLVDHRLDDCSMPQLVGEDVNALLISLLKLFMPRLTPMSGIHPAAVIEPTAKLDTTVAVGPGAYIAHGVTIGSHTVIGANCSIGENTSIGSDCRLDSNVVVYHNCRIGNRCVVLSNSTIGATGFGYSFIDGQHRLVPHNGGVILEDDVEIGANSCVDRAKFGNTVVGAGTKIDNQVQVAHNVKIGKLCLLAGQVGISGSVRIGDGVVLGGKSGAVDNVSIGDGVIVGARSTVTSDIEAGKKVLGYGTSELTHELKCMSIYKRLPELAKEVKQLSKKIEELEAAKDNKN